MNSPVRGFAALALAGWASSAVFAAPAAVLPADTGAQTLRLAQNLPGNADNPYNSPIRRANPNSMQGTQPSAPVIRGTNAQPVARPPTLENGGIGNGYPRGGSQPQAIDPQPSRPPRDSSDSNQR